MAGAELSTLAQRLNHLFATVPQPDGRSLYTNESAAAAITEAADVSLSHAYLSQLRTGRRDNPSARHLKAIADLFGVPLDYFFDDRVAQQVDADLDLIVAMKDANVRGVALRAHGISPEGLSGVAGIIEHIRRIEQLEDPKTPPD